LRGPLFAKKLSFEVFLSINHKTWLGKIFSTAISLA